MRNSIIVFTPLFTSRIGISGQQKCELNVSSFDLWYDNEGDKDDSRVHRKDMVVSLIYFYDLGVFGIQEGLVHQVKDLVKDDTYTFVSTGRGGGKEVEEYVTVLFKKDRFKLLNPGNYRLSETQNKPSFGWGAQCRRVCSWAKLKDRVSGKELYFLSVHFDHTDKVACHEPTLIMLISIKKTVGDLPAIYVSDFNGTPGSESTQTLKSDGLLLDSRRVSKTSPYGTVGTTNQSSLNVPMKNRIDYIFITKSIHVNKYGTLNKFQCGYYLSNHLPIMIKAELWV